MFNKAIVAAALAPLLVTVAYAHTEDHNPVRAHYVAQTLDPSPPSLTMIPMAEDEPTMEGGRMEEMRALEDGYLFWVIEKGGRPTGSAMPATEETLSDEERWQIIHHLRHGLDTPI